MPRPILHAKQRDQSNPLFRMTPDNFEQGSRAKSKMEIDRILRKKRSKPYLNAFGQLDAGGHVQNRDQVEALIETVQAEFPELDDCAFMLGCVATCYLGRPYEVHVLDRKGGIIRHYEGGQPLPDDLEKARTLALQGGYKFIEVYHDCCRAVSDNGTVSVIPG